MASTPILLIEDDLEFGAIVSHVLQFAGYKVSWAKDGIEALQMAKLESPALILSDFMLPAGGGSTFFQRLRMSPQTANTPIVILSAVAREIVEGTVGEEIHAYFLAKPYKKDELLGLIDALLLGQSRPRFLLHQAAEAASGRGRVLLVYGDLEQRSRLHSALSLNTFHVMEADNMAAAWAALENSRLEGHPVPNVVVIDAEVDFGTSPKLALQLEQTHDTQSIPVIVVTADKSQRTGFADARNVTVFLDKPLDPMRLLRQVEELVPIKS